MLIKEKRLRQLICEILSGVADDGKTVTLEKGTILYHGSPYVHSFKIPTGASWFTEYRETACQFANYSWCRKQKENDDIKSRAGIGKFRVKSTITLPREDYKNISKLIAPFMVEAKLSLSKADAIRAIKKLGWQSAELWSNYNFDETEPAYSIASKFGNFVALLDYLHKNSSFIGWVADYADSEREILLCNPSDFLKYSAFQPEKESPEDEKLQKIDDRDIKQKELEDIEDIEQENKFIALSTLFPKSGLGSPDWSDPKTKEIAKNWEKYIPEKERDDLFKLWTPY